jgi:hypothetical protein
MLAKRLQRLDLLDTVEPLGIPELRRRPSRHDPVAELGGMGARGRCSWAVRPRRVSGTKCAHCRTFERRCRGSMRVSKIPQPEWPRMESNHRTQIRSLPLYPLSYGAAQAE